MRAHSLTVTAFGPFGDTVHVDLDALSRDGLFLLCGPTGAGKTSLLDAIAFALYGRVPGARGQEKRLRSDHAAPAVRTEVVCELTLRGERVRITRRPEQVRPKSRGGGTTKDQGLLHVQRRVGDAWEPVSIRLDEGGDYLRDQIGLSPEQFWQVVLLPQGEFAEFLRAEPDQRAKVLETLFDARRFTDVEDWLAEHARTTRAALISAQDTVDRLLHRVEQAARGLPAPRSGDEIPIRPATEDPDDVLSYVSSQLGRASIAQSAASAEDEATTAGLAVAEARRDRGRRAVRAADRLLAVCRQRDFLSARSDDLAEHRMRLAAALAVEPLRPFLDRDCAAWAQARMAAANLTEAYSDLVRLDVADQCQIRLQAQDSRSGATSSDKCRLGATISPPDQLGLVTASGTGAVGAELRRWNRALRDEVARLGDLESELDAVEAEELRLVELVKVQALRQASLDELAEMSKQLPAPLADLEARRDAARISAAGVRHAVAALTAAQARVEAATRATALTKLIEAAQAERVDCEGVTMQAKAEWLSLREMRLAGIAAELAGQLADGQDCPVCGSVEHPAPAERADIIVTAADEHAAADRHQRLEQCNDLAVADVNQLRREFDACCAVTSGAPLAAVRKELSVAMIAEAGARAAAELLPGLISEHADLVTGREELTAESTTLIEAQVADRTTAKDLRARVRTDRRRLDKARGNDRSLVERRERLSALSEAAEAVERAGSAHSSASVAAMNARKDLEDRLQHCDSPSSEAAVAALLDAATRDELAAAIRHHEDSQTGLAGELSSAIEEFDRARAEPAYPVQLPTGESAAVPPSELATQAVSDLARHVREERTRLDGEHRDAATARECAVAAISATRGIRSALNELLVLLDQALAECGPLREASAQASALAALAAGGGANVKKMRLRSYVLAARLEQVAAAATARLRQMSSGRYGFVHSDDLRGGNRRSGLSVDILDSHTGTQRPTKTLSGGESFMASLALALGLADVVTAESGGIALDTLFVDEGFGGLDPESLEAVMTVLDELRQGGRVVGIVSHVEELRTRVPMQLRIRTGSHGSTLDQPKAAGDATDTLLAG